MALWAMLLLLLSTSAFAHTIRPTVVTAELSGEGELSIALRVNAEALVADVGTDHDDTDDSPNAAEYNRLRALPAGDLQSAFAEFAPGFVAALALDADGSPLELEYVGIEIPEVGDLELARSSQLKLAAVVPAGTEELGWQFPEQYGSNVLRVTVGDAPEPQAWWLDTGSPRQAIPLDPALIERPLGTVVLDYAIIGFEHIVPKGLDHILFVLGIFLLSLHLAPILWQVTAFTLAHTITLGLTIYGVISLPASIVEPLIAASIVYVGVENVLTPKLHPWRVVIVFLFGLLHGMGFAGVLSEIGLPRSEFLPALISFNVGVEVGQLAVIALALLAVGWFRDRPWYRQRIVIPGSLIIAAIGAYWTVERVFF